MGAFPPSGYYTKKGVLQFEKWCEKNGFRAGAMLDSAELAEVRNDDGEIIGAYRTNEPWTLGDDDYIDGTIEEAVYRFIG